MHDSWCYEVCMTPGGMHVTPGGMHVKEVCMIPGGMRYA